MALIDLQRELVELCCGPAPSAEQLARIGDARVFGLYRELIRNRLRGELKHALRRTAAAAGPAFDRAFEHHLRSDPPRTRYFHALVADFVRSAVPFFAADAALPRHVADLAAYEAAQWAVSDLPDPGAASIGEFAFDKQAVVSPTLRLLHLTHAVQRKPDADGGYQAGDVYLCLYRRPEEQKAKTWALNAVAFDLLQRLAAGGITTGQAVQQVAAARGIAMDEAFVDGLCTVLADAIERGVILGAQ